QKIPIRDATEAPAFVQTKRARLERVQFLGCFRSEFARFNKFLELGVHESRTNYDERPAWQANAPMFAIAVARVAGNPTRGGDDKHLVLARVQCRRFRRRNCRSCSIQTPRPRAEHAGGRSADRYLDCSLASVQPCRLENSRPGQGARISDRLRDRVLP